MSIHSLRELENTRQKLAGLDEEYAAAQARLAPDSPAREVTLRSLKKLIHQLQEEIVRFESHASSLSQS